MNKPNEHTPNKSNVTSANQDIKPNAEFDPKPSANWQLQISAAKVAWNKLTEAELVKSEGKQQQLSLLVKDRYAISSEEADKQVKDFLQKQAA